MDATSGLTLKKVVIMGIIAAVVCTVVVAGVFSYLNNKTASGIQRNIILDDINASSSEDNLGPREGGSFTRMGIINQPEIDEPIVIVETTPVEATTTKVVEKPKPKVTKPAPKPVEEEYEEYEDEEYFVEDYGGEDEEVIEDNDVEVVDNPGV